MLKKLSAVQQDPSHSESLPDNGDEDSYGVWHEFSLIDALNADRVTRQFPPNIWPNWAEGRPSKFRWTYYWASFRLGRVHHRPNQRTEALELKWQRPVLLSSLQKQPKALLPSDHSYAWSGVYRIFQPMAVPRFFGSDPTGTLYVGMAGTGKGNWSILRTRMREAATKTHHVTRQWSYGDDKLQSRYPWEDLYIEWAFTSVRRDTDGEEAPWANLAERWLLNTYRDSFGELPPLNER